MIKLFVPILAIIMIMSCNASHEHDHGEDANMHEEKMEGTKMAEATFVHTVFFWMKEDISKEESEFFESELEKLGQSPTINSYRWGKPAGTPRDVVDNSYGYAWIVDFASTADQDAYQVEPIHLAFIESCKDLWTKVQVYDTLLD
jgi:hypothetical protein